ncbi:MAG: hypothetical protein ABEJ99_01435 [Candidatus Nanohaloarchaea archaeon]
MHRRFSARKGQSAIEYLMTYGWMLLVVAIVGGAVITTVQSNQNSCKKEINGISATNQQFGVADFTTTSGGLNLQLKNNYQETVTVSSVNVTYTKNDTSVDSVSPGTSVGFGEKKTVTLTGITSSDSCSKYDVTISYDKNGLPGELTGQIQDKMA